MKRPLEFHIDNCNELLPDELRRKLGDKARADAESDNFDPPKREAINFFHAVIIEHEQIFYTHAFSKRKARLERMKQKNSDNT